MTSVWPEHVVSTVWNEEQECAALVYFKWELMGRESTYISGCTRHIWHNSALEFTTATVVFFLTVPKHIHCRARNWFWLLSRTAWWHRTGVAKLASCMQLFAAPSAARGSLVLAAFYYQTYVQLDCLCHIDVPSTLFYWIPNRVRMTVVRGNGWLANHAFIFA